MSADRSRLQDRAARRVPLVAGLVVAGLAAVLALGACTGAATETDYPHRSASTPSRNAPEGSLFGGEGLILGGGEEEDEGGGRGTGIGVNAFLWRASLDTISFMPVVSADPFGGVILTDWYAPPEVAGNERFKVNVYILDRQLRADGVQVSVFRQVKTAEGWQDAGVAPETAVDLENTILTRAREMRVEQASGS